MYCTYEFYYAQSFAFMKAVRERFGIFLGWWSQQMCGEWINTSSLANYKPWQQLELAEIGLVLSFREKCSLKKSRYCKISI